MGKLDFSKHYILEDNYVKLSPLKIEHINDLLELSKDPNIWTFLLEKGSGVKQLTKFITQTVNNRKSKKEYPFIVFDKTKKAYAGTTRFYDYSEALKVIKLGHTWYGKGFRGSGINKQCKYLLLEFAFEKLGLERVGFGAHIENKVSISAMKSIGAKEEGVLRNFIPSLDGKGRTDIILLSILKHEWEANAKFGLKSKLEKSSNKD